MNNKYSDGRRNPNDLTSDTNIGFGLGGNNPTGTGAMPGRYYTPPAPTSGASGNPHSQGVGTYDDGEEAARQHIADGFDNMYADKADLLTSSEAGKAGPTSADYNRDAGFGNSGQGNS